MTGRAFIVGANTLGLQYCINDANLLENCLKKYGYKISKPELNKTVINKEFDDLIDNSQKTDTIIVYFSGHGFIENNHLSFLLKDDAMKIVNKININALINTFSECRADNKLVILDCCSAGKALSGWQPQFSDKYLVLTASEHFERGKELDELKASFLTFYLCQLLNSPPTQIIDSDKIYISKIYSKLIDYAITHNNLHPYSQVPIPNLAGNRKIDFGMIQSDFFQSSKCATISFDNKSQKQMRYELHLGTKIILGRSPNVNIVFNHPNVSGFHAELYLTGEGLLLSDLGSKNHTFVNSNKINSVLLKTGDLVRLGKSGPVIQVVDAPPVLATTESELSETRSNM